MLTMAGRATMFLQMLFLAFALSCCLEIVRGSAEGEEVMGTVAGAETDVASSLEPSRSGFVSRRLAESGPQAGRGNVLPCSALKCQFNPLFPVCCPVLNVFGIVTLNACVNNQTDPLNCGTCGLKCGFGTVCCNGKCVNLLTDPKNCGFCGKPCPAKYNQCFFGICKYNGKF